MISIPWNIFKKIYLQRGCTTYRILCLSLCCRPTEVRSFSSSLGPRIWRPPKQVLTCSIKGLARCEVRKSNHPVQVEDNTGWFFSLRLVSFAGSCAKRSTVSCVLTWPLDCLLWCATSSKTARGAKRPVYRDDDI